MFGLGKHGQMNIKGLTKPMVVTLGTETMKLLE